MKVYAKCLGAYFSGWVLVNVIVARSGVLKRNQEKFKREVATFIVDEIERRERRRAADERRREPPASF